MEELAKLEEERGTPGYAASGGDYRACDFGDICEYADGGGVL